jgi:hypothetical protein
MFKIYASKNIDENEELYLCYGVEYWITKIQLETDEPFTRLFCYLKNDIVKINDNIIYFENEKIKALKLFELLRISPNGNIITVFKLNKLSNNDKMIELIKLLN